MMRTKRVYEEPVKGDGFRILVDRLWPRGLSKDRARIDLWLKEVAPSGALRNRRWLFSQWFGHDRTRWAEFKRRYFKELANKKEAIEPIVKKASQVSVTLLYGARDEECNNAVALQEFIEQKKHTS